MTESSDQLTSDSRKEIEKIINEILQSLESALEADEAVDKAIAELERVGVDHFALNQY